ncbi:hypothetical protein L1887_48305 [Cichorium endivia]|nr:hypothetical protein L1887_48305 [Cichorium endivia]
MWNPGTRSPPLFFPTGASSVTWHGRQICKIEATVKSDPAQIDMSSLTHCCQLWSAPSQLSVECEPPQTQRRIGKNNTSSKATKSPNTEKASADSKTVGGTLVVTRVQAAASEHVVVAELRSYVVEVALEQRAVATLEHLVALASGQVGLGRDGLRANPAIADHDHLALAGHAVDHHKGERRAGGEQVRVGRQLGNVELAALASGLELDHALTHVHAVRGESGAHKHHLGLLRIRSRGQRDGEAVAAVREGARQATVGGTRGIVELGVPALDAVLGLPLGVGVVVRVRVRAGDEDRRVRKQRSRRVVKTADVGASNALPAVALARLGVVHKRLVRGVVAVRLTHRATGSVGVGVVASDTGGDTVAEPQLAIGKLDELTHGSALRQVIDGLPRGTASHRADLLTRCRCWQLRNGDGWATLVAPVGCLSEAHTTAEEHGLLVAVFGAERKQSRSSRGRVDTRRTGDGGKRTLALLLVVPQDGFATRLDEDLAGRHEVRDRVERQRNGALEDGQVAAASVSLDRVELVGGVVGALAGHEASVAHASKDDVVAVGKRLDGGVPPFRVELVAGLVVPLALLVVAGRKESKRASAVVRSVALARLGIGAVGGHRLVATRDEPSAIAKGHATGTEDTGVSDDLHSAGLAGSHTASSADKQKSAEDHSLEGHHGLGIASHDEDKRRWSTDRRVKSVAEQTRSGEGKGVEREGVDGGEEGNDGEAQFGSSAPQDGLKYGSMPFGRLRQQTGERMIPYKRMPRHVTPRQADAAAVREASRARLEPGRGGSREASTSSGTRSGVCRPRRTGGTTSEADHSTHFSLACICISTMASRHDAIAIQTRTMHTGVKGGPQPKDEHSFAGEVRVCYELQPHAASSETNDGSSVRMQDDKRHGFQPRSATTSHDGVWRPGECATMRRWICDLSPLSSRDEKIGGTRRQTAPPARSDASSDPLSLLGNAPVAATLLRACVRVVDKSHGHARIGTAWHGCQFARCLCAARGALAVERLNVGAACIPRNTNAGDASWHVSIRPQPSCNTLFSPASARVTSFSVFTPNSFRQSACRLPIPDIADAHKPIDLSAVCAQR